MGDQLNILFRAKVKEGKEKEFLGVARELTKAAADEEGCITFTYHQNTEDPRDFFLYEQWRDGDAIKGHLSNLKAFFGESDAEGLFPPKLLSYWDEWKAEKYRVI